MSHKDNINLKVDFYLIDAGTTIAAWRFACHLAEQFYTGNKRLYLYMRSVEDAQKIDSLLWTYKDISFLPHAFAENEFDQSSPPAIVIGNMQMSKAAQKFDAILNLSENIPTHLSQFSHLIELVYGDTQSQQSARERYRYYRDQKFTLNTIKT